MSEASGLFKKVCPALEHLKGNTREPNRPSPKELPSCWQAFQNQRVQAQPSGTFIEKASSNPASSFVGNTIPAVWAISGAQVTRAAYWYYVSTELSHNRDAWCRMMALPQRQFPPRVHGDIRTAEGRERRWRLFSTDPVDTPSNKPAYSIFNTG